MASHPLGDIADLVGGRLVGQSDIRISSLGTLENARGEQLSHLSARSYKRYLPTTRAAAVILRESDLAQCPCAAILVEDPYLAFAKASHLFETSPLPSSRIDSSANIAGSAVLGQGVGVECGAVIRDRVSIGQKTVIGANSVIGEGVILGEQVRIMPGVVIYHGVVIGDRTVIHSGSVIGADGFGFAPDERGRLQAIAQTGSVVIGADVSIGACSTIDRGAIDDTRIGDGVKIDNQVQIGHNCEIGDHTILCGCVGLAGSTKIGKHCVIAGAVGMAGDGPIEIADGVIISAMTHVAKSIAQAGVYSGGVPHCDNRRWRRNIVRFNELDALAKRLNKLEKKMGKDL